MRQEIKRAGRRAAAAAMIAAACCGAGTAQAATHHHTAHAATSCAGLPTLTLTVSNQAHASAAALAAVERAASDQSLQVRAYWGTPCIRFAPGGFALRLSAGPIIQNADGSTTRQIGGVHNPDGSIDVETGATDYHTWARAFTHETVERLADPDGKRMIAAGSGGLASLEIADPVESDAMTYALDGLQVSDWVTGRFYADAPAGPYDWARKLAAGI